MTPHPTIEFGIADDAAATHRLYEQARAWIRERGIAQWTHPVPRSVFEADAAAGRLLVARYGDKLIAMAVVTEEDLAYWGPQENPAVYVHRLVVASEHRGRGIADSILEWVSARAAEQGKQFLRLDCGSDNQGLRRFYERSGFTAVRDSDVADPATGSTVAVTLYQRRVPSRYRRS